MEPLHAARPHLQGSADFHHVVLLDHGHSEVVGLHELLQESAVGFILAAWESIKSALDCDSNLWAITQQHLYFRSSYSEGTPSWQWLLLLTFWQSQKWDKRCVVGGK